MNKNSYQWQTTINIASPAKGKLPYTPPHFEVIEVEEVRFICTSVEPGQGGSVEKDFDEKGDIGGGEWEVEDED